MNKFFLLSMNFVNHRPPSSLFANFLRMCSSSIRLNPQVIYREGVSKTEGIISQQRTEKRQAI